MTWGDEDARTNNRKFVMIIVSKEANGSDVGKNQRIVKLRLLLLI